MERIKNLEEKRAAQLKKEIRVSIVKQVIKPTFDKSAWQAGASTTEQLGKPDNAEPVQNRSPVLKKDGFNKSSWLPPIQQATQPAAQVVEKSVGFNRTVWKPNDGKKDSEE